MDLLDIGGELIWFGSVLVLLDEELCWVVLVIEVLVC